MVFKLILCLSTSCGQHATEEWKHYVFSFVLMVFKLILCLSWGLIRGEIAKVSARCVHGPLMTAYDAYARPHVAFSWLEDGVKMA